MFENFLYFRCPHQREIRPAGAQQVLLRIADVEMLQHRLQWAERMGIGTVLGRAIRWRGLLPLKIVLPLPSNSKDGRVRG